MLWVVVVVVVVVVLVMVVEKEEGKRETGRDQSNHLVADSCQSFPQYC